MRYRDLHSEAIKMFECLFPGLEHDGLDDTDDPDGPPSYLIVAAKGVPHDVATPRVTVNPRRFGQPDAWNEWRLQLLDGAGPAEIIAAAIDPRDLSCPDSPESAHRATTAELYRVFSMSGAVRLDQPWYSRDDHGEIDGVLISSARRKRIAHLVLCLNPLYSCVANLGVAGHYKCAPYQFIEGEHSTLCLIAEDATWGRIGDLSGGRHIDVIKAASVDLLPRLVADLNGQIEKLRRLILLASERNMPAFRNRALRNLVARHEPITATIHIEDLS